MVFKVKKEFITEATYAMNECCQWFKSYVIDVEKSKDFYLVTVKSTFDYGYITNQWNKFIIE